MAASRYASRSASAIARPAQKSVAFFIWLTVAYACFFSSCTKIFQPWAVVSHEAMYGTARLSMVRTYSEVSAEWPPAFRQSCTTPKVRRSARFRTPSSSCLANSRPWLSRCDRLPVLRRVPHQKEVGAEEALHQRTVRNDARAPGTGTLRRRRDRLRQPAHLRLDPLDGRVELARHGRRRLQLGLLLRRDECLPAVADQFV